MDSQREFQILGLTQKLRVLNEGQTNGAGSKIVFESDRTRRTTSMHTHPFNSPMSGTTQVSRYQKGKTNLDFTGARDSEWQWHQLGHMKVCTLLQTDNHVSTPPLSFFTGRMPFLPPNQQRQSTEGNDKHAKLYNTSYNKTNNCGR